MPSPKRENYPNNNAYEKARANYNRKGKRPAGASPSKATLENVVYETNLLHMMDIPNLEALMKVSHKMRNIVGPILRNKIRTAKTLLRERTAETRARREPLVAQLRRRGHETLSNNNKKFLMETNYASMRQKAYNKGLMPKSPVMGLAPAPTTVISRNPFRGYTEHMRRMFPYGSAWLNTSHYITSRNNRYKSTGQLTAAAKRYGSRNSPEAIARRVAQRWLRKVRARKNT